MHYVVFSKCGGCLDTSILEITVSLLAAFHVCWFPPTSLREDLTKTSAELIYAAHVEPASDHPDFPSVTAQGLAHVSSWG